MTRPSVADRHSFTCQGSVIQKGSLMTRSSVADKLKIVEVCALLMCLLLGSGTLSHLPVNLWCRHCLRATHGWHFGEL